jgi:hypothetical protein
MFSNSFSEKKITDIFISSTICFIYLTVSQKNASSLGAGELNLKFFIERNLL